MQALYTNRSSIIYINGIITITSQQLTIQTLPEESGEYQQSRQAANAFSMRTTSGWVGPSVARDTVIARL